MITIKKVKSLLRRYSKRVASLGLVPCLVEPKLSMQMQLKYKP